MVTMMTPKYHEIFSPTIMESEVSQKFLDIVNKVGDNILSDEITEHTLPEMIQKFRTVLRFNDPSEEKKPINLKTISKEQDYEKVL